MIVRKQGSLLLTLDSCENRAVQTFHAFPYCNSSATSVQARIHKCGLGVEGTRMETPKASTGVGYPPPQ